MKRELIRDHVEDRSMKSDLLPRMFRVAVIFLWIFLAMRLLTGCAASGCAISNDDRITFCDDLCIYESYHKYPRLSNGAMSWELIAMRQQYQHSCLMTCMLRGANDRDKRAMAKHKEKDDG